jgi:O-glycosyl hydrolase
MKIILQQRNETIFNMRESIEPLRFAAGKRNTRRFLVTLILVGLHSMVSAQPPSPRIAIDVSQRYQTIDGFGVNFNATYFRPAQKPMIDMLVKDLGATIFRLDPYGLINWEAANDNDDPEQMNWLYYNDRYSIPEFEAAWAAGRYLNTLGIRPYLTLSGVPPKWMLDDDRKTSQSDDTENSHKENTHTHLNHAMYGEFAETVVSLAMYARNTAHVDYEYFGPVNETDCYPNEGPGIDTEEMPAVLAAVATRLKKEGLGDVKLVVAEQCNMAHNYIGPMLKEPALMPSVGAFSLHLYDDKSDASPHVKAVQASAYPNIPVWLTEYGDLKDLDQSPDNEWKGFSVASTRRVLRTLNAGVTAALFWDAFDNYHEHYPRFTYYGLFANHNNEYAPKKRYYAARQLYHFVHPGAQRIKVEGPAGVTMAGFVNGDDGSVVIVGVQEGGAQTLNVSLPGYDGEWQVFQTTPQLNCQRTGTELTSKGEARVHLEKDSIFTLVLPRRTAQ